MYTEHYGNLHELTPTTDGRSSWRTDQELQFEEALDPYELDQQYYGVPYPIVPATRSSSFGQIIADATSDEVDSLYYQTDSESEDESGQKKKPRSKMSILGSVAILTKSCMGAGMLGIPYAMRLCGLIPGLFMLFGTAFLGFFSFYFLAEARRHTRCRSYDHIVTWYWGIFGERLLQISIFITLFGAGILYLVVVADNLTGILERYSSSLPRFLLLLLPMLCVFPLTLLRELSALRWASSAGLMCLLYLFFVMFQEFLWPDLAKPMQGAGQHEI
eukprot:g17842.t1